MIAIGADHGGFELKGEIIKYFQKNNIEYKDFGTYSSEAVDYPDIAAAVAEGVLHGGCRLGILVCGTGIGISIAANKIKGIRAACCSDYFGAKYTRLHNDANILCLGGRIIGAGLAEELVEVFLNTEFCGGERHKNRIAKIAKLESLDK